MRYCCWYNKCPYIRQFNHINYPASAYPDGYMAPLPEYYSDDFYFECKKTAELEPVENTVEGEYPIINSQVAQQDVTRVIGIINQRISQEIDEVMRIGMDRKLVDYLIRTIVQYIDKNYDRYQDSIQRKVEMAIFDMKRDLGWAFDIMRIYNVSPATENRLLDKAANAAVQGLRPQLPEQMPISSVSIPK